eukprot:350500-Chlamydomonas_euryale.AAC.4
MAPLEKLLAQATCHGWLAGLMQPCDTLAPSAGSAAWGCFLEMTGSPQLLKSLCFLPLKQTTFKNPHLSIKTKTFFSGSILDVTLLKLAHLLDAHHRHPNTCMSKLILHILQIGCPHQSKL